MKTPALVACAASMLWCTALSTAALADGLPTPTKCNRQVAPPEARLESGLLVLEPPEPPRAPGGQRLRSHTEDNHHLGEHWAGPPVPAFVPISQGVTRLDVLDRVGDFVVALYREPFSAIASSRPIFDNSKYEVRVFDCNGKVVASVSPNAFFSRKSHLEVADMRFDGDRTLLFNEACITYSREAGGRCSSLLAVDVITGKLKWRSQPKRSNNVFRIAGDYIIAGYGFTGEPSALHILRRSDGRVVRSHSLRVNVFPGGNHDALSIQGDTLRVGVYESDKDLLFQMSGFDGPAPTLRFKGNATQPRQGRASSTNRQLPPHIDKQIKRRKPGHGF